MANYAVEHWPTSADTVRYASAHQALSALETQLETIDTTKTIRLIGIMEVGEGKYFVPYIIYDT